jgi:tight adherence protein B
MRFRLDVLDALRLSGLVLCAVGIFSLIYLVGFTETPLSRVFNRYVHYLDKTLGLLFKERSGLAMARMQVGVILAIAMVEIAIIDIPYWWAALALAAFGPALNLSLERSKRVAKLELQVDGFILALANSMKTVPAPGAALEAIIPILQNPTRQEIERVVKEMRVGNTLDQSLVNMSARIGSKTLDSALSSVLIGLQVGGNLPQVLETTASTIREMNRLDGVVKTKTSEGKAQLWVLAVFPFAICGAFNWVQPGYFDILQKSFTGYAIITVSMLLWVGSLLLARKVLTVDI